MPIEGVLGEIAIQTAIGSVVPIEQIGVDLTRDTRSGFHLNHPNSSGFKDVSIRTGVIGHCFTQIKN